MPDSQETFLASSTAMPPTNARSAMFEPITLPSEIAELLAIAAEIPTNNSGIVVEIPIMTKAAINSLSLRKKEIFTSDFTRNEPPSTINRQARMKNIRLEYGIYFLFGYTI
jgi:hypothetical protein